MVCPCNRVELVIVVGMDSQNTANLISLGSMLAAIASAIIAGLQAAGSKKARAKADEAHKAALDMRDAAQRSAEVAQEKVKQAKRSAKAAEEQANQAELARKAAEERVRQAEKSLEQMQQIVAEQQSQSQSQSKIAASLQSPPFELTSTGSYHYLLRNTTTETLKILEVVNCDSFIKWDNEWYGLNDPFPWELHPDQSSEVYLPRSASVLNLELKVEGKDNSIFITIPK